MILLDILTQRVYNIIRIGGKALRTKSWTGSCQISPNLRLYSIGLKP